jgi:hypothetical protein
MPDMSLLEWHREFVTGSPRWDSTAEAAGLNLPWQFNLRCSELYCDFRPRTGSGSLGQLAPYSKGAWKPRSSSTSWSRVPLGQATRPSAIDLAFQNQNFFRSWMRRDIGLLRSRRKGLAWLHALLCSLDHLVGDWP